MTEVSVQGLCTRRISNAALKIINVMILLQYQTKQCLDLGIRSLLLLYVLVYVNYEVLASLIIELQ
jgi:hypothetical protein